MNGPRTNQFVAPTSFITSISRRREKIDSRIVFAISSVEAIRRIAVATMKIASIQCAIWRIRLDACLPSVTVCTPGGSGCRLAATSWTYSPFVGVISSESGSGLYGRSLVSFG